MNGDIQFFSDGAAYEQLMGRWSRLVGYLFLDWLGAPRGLRWLDVGCGNGAFTETIVTRCAPAEVQGIDPSNAQIAYAQTREAARYAQFRTGDAQVLPFENAHFDVAAMALVISFIPNPAKAVTEMVRVVRPGGWVASYMWDAPGHPLAPIHDAARALGLATPPGPPDVEVSRLANMQTLWQSAGLEAVEVRRIDIEVSFADFDDFLHSNTTLSKPVAGYLRALPVADQERVRDWLHKSLPRDATGRIRYGAFANAAKGLVPR